MKSNVKRVKGNVYYFWGDGGRVDWAYEHLDDEDSYRHSVGNYFEREEDVKPFEPCAFCNEEIYDGEPLKQEFLPAPAKTSEEEKFVQMFEDEGGQLTGVTNKGRVLQGFYNDEKWASMKLPDFKTIK